MMRFSKAILIVFFLNLTLASFSWAGEAGILDSLIKEALDNNPHLEAMRKSWKAKEAKILSKKSIPQPKVKFTYFGESVYTKAGPQEKKYGLMQQVPFPTKLSLKGRIAYKEAELARIRYILSRNELVMELKTIFYDYYFTKITLGMLGEEKAILENMRMAVQRKYEAAEAPQQDLVKADLEIAKIDDRILTFEKRINTLRAQINRLTDQPQERKISLKKYKLNTDTIDLNKESYRKKVLNKSPLICLDKINVGKQESKLSLARQGYLPDFNFMADYIEIGDGTTNFEKDGQDAWMVGVSITFPLWFWKIESDIKSERSNYQASQNKLKDKKSFLLFKVEDLLFKLKNKEKLVDLYKNIILPQAKQSFSTSRISYESGKVDFLNWLEAEKNLINVKIANLRQITDYKKIQAQLEYIAGELPGEEKQGDKK